MNIMDGNPAALVRPAEHILHDLVPQVSAEQVIEFYEEASADYEHWSRGLNMHIGLYRSGVNPFDRERMLEQLNLEIASRLQLDPEAEAFLIDLGCGAGAVARTVAQYYKNSVVKGVTVAPSQVKIASELNIKAGLDNRVEIFREDFTALPFRACTADGAWAVESSCYASGAGKEDLIQETARVLKTGGRFVVADCFVRQPEKKFNPLVKKAYRAACRCWAVPEMPMLEHFVAALEKHGFRDILVEDISWRAAPSVAHAPFAVSTFLLKKLLAAERLSRHSINNLKASLLAVIIGLSRSKFRYCMISSTSGKSSIKRQNRER